MRQRVVLIGFGLLALMSILSSLAPQVARAQSQIELLDLPIDVQTLVQQDAMTERLDLRAPGIRIFERADGSGFAVVVLDAVNVGSGYNGSIQEGFPAVATCNAQRGFFVGYDPENVGKKRTRAFVHLSLPTLPNGSSITSATLRLWQYYSGYGGVSGYTARVYRATSNWADPNLCRSGNDYWTWNYPPGIDWGTVYSNNWIAKGMDWRGIDITGLVQQWYSGTPNQGLALVGNPETDRGSYFCASVAYGSQCGVSDAQNYHPYAVINYQVIAPSAPSNLSATTVLVSQIDLSWQDNSNSEDGFKIERSPTGSNNWTQVATVGANVTSFQNTGLVCGTNYYYRVRAYNAGGDSSYSGTASATTVICAPSGLGATTASVSQINLSWTDNSNNETGFKIERSLTGSGNWTQIATVGANTTTYPNTGLACSTTYYYRVQAYNASSSSSYSNTASATTVICAPSGLSATTASASQINLTWQDNSSNEDGFKIERSLSGTEGWTQIITVGTNVTSSPSTGLICGTTYYYRVRAYNAGGYSSYSNNASAMTVVCPPTAPSNLQAVSVSASQVTLTWTDNSNNEDGFKIERFVASDNNWIQIAAVGINFTTYQNTGLTCGDTYSYRVRAYNTGGHSEYSGITSSSVLPCAPTLDAIINTGDGGVFPISWQPVAGALGYALQEASASDFSGASIVYSGAATSTVITGKVPGLYYYRVRAFNSAGVSIWSNVQTILISLPDLYEPDNTCTQARTTLPDGMIQEHTFHRYADEDWVVFEAIAGANYRIDAQIPPASLADVELEVYDHCTGAPLDGQGYAFAPGVVLEFTSPISGAIYLRWANTEPAVFGESVAYHISVRDLSQETFHGAVVIVAGREKPNDILQSNIHYAANQVYQLFQAHGYPSERIFYLATDSTLPGFNAPATAANLQTALTTWAAERTNSERPLTLYLIDHGSPNMVYLDRPAGEFVTPAQIDTWLTQLETARPGVKINVIVEACNSGSFINLPQTVSKSGRVVITSTGPRNLAFASSQGAMFSDFFLAALWQGQSLYQAFQNACWATQDAFPHQSPWLDDNGNSTPNEDLDGQEAALRGFAYPGTLSGVQWPPHIVQASGPDVITQGQGIIHAEVRDDEQVARVWAVVYPPSYVPPETGDELTLETLPPVPLTPLGSDQFTVNHTGFTEIGVYRIVLYAEDNGGRMARPFTLEVRSGWRVYLPMLIRE